MIFPTLERTAPPTVHSVIKLRRACADAWAVQIHTHPLHPQLAPNRPRSGKSWTPRSISTSNSLSYTCPDRGRYGSSEITRRQLISAPGIVRLGPSSMDEYTADAFANRDEPIPLLTVTDSDIETSPSETDQQATRKRDRLRKTLSASTIKGIAHNYGNEQAQRLGSASGLSLQDRLFAK